MSIEHHTVTAEELLKMPLASDKPFELIDGEIVDVSPVNDLHMTIMELLVDLLRDHVRSRDLGLVRPDGLGYVLRRDPDTVRAPDVSFVAWESVPEGPPSARFWEGPPTLAVEIVSPHDRAGEIHRKVQDYLEAGARQVWVLWPEQASISVYSPDADTREVGADSILNGGDVLPGFSVRVGDLFDVHQRR